MSAGIKIRMRLAGKAIGASSASRRVAYPDSKRRFANLPTWEQRGNNKRFSLLWPLLNAPKNTRKYLMLHRCVH
jgi:hypothetical protein